MSNQLHPSVCKKYIVASFLEACCKEQFHHRWMTADTWSDLIFHVDVNNVDSQCNNWKWKRSFFAFRDLIQSSPWLSTNMSCPAWAMVIWTKYSTYHSKHKRKQPPPNVVSFLSHVLSLNLVGMSHAPMDLSHQIEPTNGTRRYWYQLFVILMETCKRSMAVFGLFLCI